VLAAGAWLPGMLPASAADGYAVQRQALHWFRSAQPAWHAPDAMPPFVWMHGRAGEAFYGFPMIDDAAGVKLATEQSVCTTDPDDVERRVDAAESAALFESHVRGRLRGIDAATVRTAACLYTCRAEGRFLVDRHPSLEHATVVSACSGHGFKHSAALGEAVADRLAGRTPRVDLAPFAAPPTPAG
jgi:sarcosine oxidase